MSRYIVDNSDRKTNSSQICKKRYATSTLIRIHINHICTKFISNRYLSHQYLATSEMNIPKFATLCYTDKLYPIHFLNAQICSSLHFAKSPKSPLFCHIHMHQWLLRRICAIKCIVRLLLLIHADSVRNMHFGWIECELFIFRNANV